MNYNIIGMDKPIYLSLSVHELVDFLLRKGDIDNRVYNDETMAFGTKIHASFQKKQGKEYLSEVPLSERFSRPLGTIILEGRADGIIEGGEYPIVDEIKSTVAPIYSFYETQNEWHFGQAYCYALMYAHERKLKKMGVRITYISQIDGKELRKEVALDVVELEEKVYGFLDRYLFFYQSVLEHEERFKTSAKAISFPYPAFRIGQREMAKYIYSVCLDEGTFFCEAPTGIGKTMSALYPAIKALGNSKKKKIFYLTAKSTGRESAFHALSLLEKKGLYFRDSFLRAKDKMCLSPLKACNPDECPFAKDYYEKLRNVIKTELLACHHFSYEYVIEIATKNKICPFELQLDLSLFSDIIVCDFNYFFDPFVYLDRYFGPEAHSSDFIILIDEAHNLVNRASDMYSASLSLSMVKKVKKDITPKKLVALKRSLTKLEKFFKEENASLKEEYTEYDVIPKALKSAFNSIEDHRKDLMTQKDVFLRGNGENYKEFSREIYRLTKLLEQYDQNSLLFFKKGDDPFFSLQCLNPSPYLRGSLDKVKSKAIFSATLSPIDFYMDEINNEKAPYLLLDSPFPKDNFSLLIAPMVSTRFKDRDKTMDIVANYLKAFVDAKIGNYFLYFPSYDYLLSIKDKLSFEHAAVFVQEKNMSEDERIIFLKQFQPNPTHTSVGIVTINGVFSEGVDLVGSRLEGVAVVGIGLPTISFERNKIKEYFDAKEKNGFEFAYMDPGINRVMQAVGRLIRSETDKGIALLIDDRYLCHEYHEIFSRRYPNYHVVTSSREVEEQCKNIYKIQKNKK